MTNPWLSFLGSRLRPALFLTICLLSSALTSSGAMAHSAISSGENNNLARLTERADLIAITTVEEVIYMTATFSGQSGQMPLTFVTFRLEKVLRGKQPSPRLTLRFMGGSDGMGGFMGVSGVPRFQKGDRDFLFVTGNGTQACALAYCEWGRFRILDDRVYNTHGFPVTGLPKNHVIAFGMPPEPFQVFRYPAPDFDAIMKNPLLQKELPQLMKSSGMSVDEARAKYQANAQPFVEMRTKYDPRDFEVSRAELTEGNPNIVSSAIVSRILAGASQNIPANGANSAVSLSGFTSAVARLANANRRPFQIIDSVSPSIPVVFKPVARVSGPVPKYKPFRSTKESAADRAWREAEERDPFNPGQKPKGAK